CTILWFQFSLAGNKKKYFVLTTFGVIFSLTLYLNLEFVDKLLVSISFPTILLFIIIDKVLKRSSISFDWRLSVNYISFLAIAIAILSTFLVISYILFPDYPLPSLNYLYYFYLILAIFSPLFLLVISFSYPVVVTFRRLKKRWCKSSVKKEENIVIKGKHAKGKHVKRTTRVFHLSVIIFLSIIIAMVPHVSTINKDNQVIGVDTKDYSKLLESMSKSSGLEELLHKVFVTLMGGDRPFTLLSLLILYNVLSQGNFSSLLENLPLLLSPLLVVSVYFLTLGITRDHLTSILASLITIPSHILIGVYGGLYANWLSLTWSYLAILFLFKILDEPKRINFCIFSSLLVILIFSHTPTWNILLYVIGLFLLVTFFLYKRANKKIYLYIIFSILPSVIIDLGRMLLLNTSGMQQEIGFALQREVGIHGVHTIWENLIATTHFTLAGQIGNPIILLLVVYWLYSIEIKEKYAIFFIIFFSLFVLPFLFGDGQIQSRFFFEIPIQIPTAIALMVLKERIGNYMPIAICLWLIVMSAYMAANFVLVIH
ncbi:MAG: hypothetical protein L0H55_07685, partial [Candidatus Nitrosocosmicus sp.]|nr:hypothetical protein [Candidatus Nitrosocosmicus sp.]